MTNRLGEYVIENRKKWDTRFLEQARLISTYSKDRTQVGAVIVNDLRQIVGNGYNGFPRGIVDSEERFADRDTKLLFTVHAEVNACITAGHNARGGTLYVYPPLMEPNICPDCCKVVIQSGIKRIVGYKSDNLSDRWQKFGLVSQAMCDEANIRIDYIER